MFFLKLNDGPKIYNQLFYMLYLFATLEKGKTEYTRAVLTYIILLQHHKDNNDVIWQMFVRDPSCFNEEIGEQSFGVLMRSLNGNPNRSRIGWVNERWQLVKHFRAATGEIEGELVSSGGPTKPVQVHSQCDEVNATRVFMKQVCSELNHNRYQLYHLNHMKSRDDALQHMVKPMGFPRLRNKRVFPKLRKNIDRFASQIINANILSKIESRRWFEVNEEDQSVMPVMGSDTETDIQQDPNIDDENSTSGSNGSRSHSVDDANIESKFDACGSSTSAAVLTRPPITTPPPRNRKRKVSTSTRGSRKQSTLRSRRRNRSEQSASSSANVDSSSAFTGSSPSTARSFRRRGQRSSAAREPGFTFAGVGSGIMSLTSTKDSLMSSRT